MTQESAAGHEPSAKIVKTIQTLAQIAEDLRQGKNFEVTRLTMLKSLCSDPEATAQFALYLVKKTQQGMKARGRSRYTEPEAWKQYQRLVAKAVRELTHYMKSRTKEAESSLRDLRQEVRGVQNEYEHQQWVAVRIIHSRDVLVAEMALDCVLTPTYSSVFGYRMARDYAERYDAHYGRGLIPASAPLVEDIAEFWGRHLLGRGWRKRLPR